MYSKFLDHFKTLRFLLAWYLSLKSKKGTKQSAQRLIGAFTEAAGLGLFYTLILRIKFDTEIIGVCAKH